MRPSHGVTSISGYGVGIVWWPELDPLCRPGEGLVHVIEAEPKTFCVPRDASSFKSGLSHALVHAATGMPIAFENPVSYLPPYPGELPDGVFAAEVAEAADCGILLDLHNLLCNERNGRQTVVEYCRSIPLERVSEIHLAGGQFERGFWLDAHSGVVEPALLEILAEILPRLPSVRALIFEIVPDFIAASGLGAIATCLGQLNEIWAARPRAAAPVERLRSSVASSDTLKATEWEAAIGAAVTGCESPGLAPDFAGWRRSAEESLALYRFLAQEGRACALVDTAPRTIRSLLTALGEARTRDLLDTFWMRSAPAHTNAQEAWGFLEHLCSVDVAVPGLAADVADNKAALVQLGAAHQ